MQISINNTVCKISHDYIQATVCWCHVPGRQQKIKSIRDRIRWAVWTVVITGNDCYRFEIDPIWTQSSFKLNRTNLNRSQSIYMWTRSYRRQNNVALYIQSCYIFQSLLFKKWKQINNNTILRYFFKNTTYTINQ
jgi:hypothetical protein